MDHHEPNHPKPKWDDLIKFQQWKESKIMGMLREKQKKVEMLDEEMDALKIKWKKDGEELLKLREEEEFRRDHRGHLAGYNMMVYR